MKRDEILKRLKVNAGAFISEERSFYQMMLRLMISAIEENKKEFRDSTRFSLAIQDKPEGLAKFERDCSDDFNCVMSLDTNQFIEFCTEFIQKNRFSNKYKKYIEHEIAHYIDFIHNRSLFSKVPAENADNTHLFRILIRAMRTEGLAEMHRKKDAQVVEMDGDALVKFRTNLHKLAYSFHLDRERLEKVLQDHFFDDLYKVSFMICFIIALSKQGRVDINKIISKNSKIANVPKDAYDQTIEEIKDADEEEFIRIYEKSCDTLGVKQKYRVIWWRIYVKFNRIMTEERERFRKKQLKRMELDPVLETFGEKMASIFGKD